MLHPMRQPIPRLTPYALYLLTKPKPITRADARRAYRREWTRRRRASVTAQKPPPTTSVTPQEPKM